MSEKYPQIEITDDELKKIVYFTTMLFKADSLHMQGTSAKSDLIGGYLERWVNKSAESIIFDELLKDKSYEAVCDYFLYSGKDVQKNAPDILGLKNNNGAHIPFVKFKDSKWVRVEGRPRIEVKVMRKNQYLATVREPQMIDDFYVFIESDLEPDYLTSLFDTNVFDDKYFNELSMDDSFIESDTENNLLTHVKPNRASKVGTMRLMGIYTKEEFKRLSILLAKSESPYYLQRSEAHSGLRIYGVCDEQLAVSEEGLVVYSNGEDGPRYIPFLVEDCSSRSLKLLGKSKSTAIIKTEEKIKINGQEFDPGFIKLCFTKFERGSAWDENTVSKYVLEKIGKDSRKLL